MKKPFSLLLALTLLPMAVLPAFAGTQPAEKPVLTVTDYLDGAADTADAIQALIDSNPNRTLYFPDGTYTLSHPIVTPADPAKSVDLRLTAYALLEPADGWTGDALVILGGKDPKNDTHTPGSVYGLTGGILDGKGKTGGVIIAGGRESYIREVSMKNVTVGVYIKYGANSGSSDADVRDVNIIGTGDVNSVGVLAEGYDNTFTNMRIGNVYTGVHIKSGGNSLKNIHPLYYSDYTDYENSCGFLDESSNNLYDYCYSDQFGIGFRTTGNGSNTYSNCFCWWYSPAGKKETCFRADGEFNSIVTNMRIGFSSETENTVLSAAKTGRGVFANTNVDAGKRGTDLTYLFYDNQTPLSRLRAFVIRIRDLFATLGGLLKK